MESVMESGESAEDEHHSATLFSTRLREFDEKNDLAFHHIRRHSYGSDEESGTGLGADHHLHHYFGDQYSRHSPCFEDLLDEDKELFAAIEAIFNKLSIQEVEESHGTTVKSHKLAEAHLESILSKIGQQFNKLQLEQYIKSNVKGGFVDFNGYQRILVHFLKDPDSIARIKTEHNRLF